MLWFWTVRAAPRDAAPVAFALPPSTRRKNLQTSRCFNRPRRWVSATKKKLKNTRRAPARSMWTYGPEVGRVLTPLVLPRAAAAAALRVAFVCLVRSSLSFRRIDERSSFDRRLEGRGKQKKMLLCVFWFLEKKRRVFYTPREWTAPDGSRRAGARPGAPFETTFPYGKLSRSLKDPSFKTVTGRYRPGYARLG